MPTAAAIAPASGGNLSPTAPGLSGAAAGGDLEPANPTQAAPNGKTSTLRISGSLTSDGETEVVFPFIPKIGLYGGKAAFQSADPPPVSGEYAVAVWDTDHWAISYIISMVTVASWHSSEDVASPDLVETWTPQGDATGDPTVTLEELALTPSASATASAAGGNLSPTAPGAIAS